MIKKEESLLAVYRHGKVMNAAAEIKVNLSKLCLPLKIGVLTES